MDNSFTLNLSFHLSPLVSPGVFIFPPFFIFLLYSVYQYMIHLYFCFYSSLFSSLSPLFLAQWNTPPKPYLLISNTRLSVDEKKWLGESVDKSRMYQRLEKLSQQTITCCRPGTRNWNPITRHGLWFCAILLGVGERLWFWETVVIISLYLRLSNRDAKLKGKSSAALCYLIYPPKKL